MILDIFSFASLFMCYYTRVGGNWRKTEKFTIATVILKDLVFQHDERQKDDTQNHDIENETKRPPLKRSKGKRCIFLDHTIRRFPLRQL
jgi:hypothetical protein